MGRPLMHAAAACLLAAATFLGCLNLLGERTPPVGNGSKAQTSVCAKVVDWTLKDNNVYWVEKPHAFRSRLVHIAQYHSVLKPFIIFLFILLHLSSLFPHFPRLSYSPAYISD
ncbi:hypothetical protein ABW19_dt0206622 [Dactylella cylindrospora]|nr:hypothetical protein ABW19_dt0206622 [Dactylella cylindrospora]